MSPLKNISLILSLFILAACDLAKPAEPPKNTPAPLQDEKPDHLTSFSYQRGYVAKQAQVVGGVAYIDAAAAGDSPSASRIWALDITTGQLVWSIEQNLLLPSTHDQNRIFALTQDGIAAYSMIGGVQEWITEVPLDEYPVGELLASEDGLVFYADSTSVPSSTSVYGLNAQTGLILWSQVLDSGLDPFASGSLPESGYRAIGYSEGILYLRMNVDYYHWKYVAIEAKSGTRLWEFTFESAIPQEGIVTGVASEPVFAQERLFFGTHDNHFYALNAKTGQVLWDRDEAFLHPFSANELLYAMDAWGKRLNAFDAQSGELIWTKPVLDESELGRFSGIVLDEQIILYIAPVNFDDPIVRITASNARTGQETYAIQTSIPEECSGNALALSVYSGNLYGITARCVIIAPDFTSALKQ